MQMKRQLADRRTAAQLREEAEECHRAGFDGFADLLWQESEMREAREERARRRRDREED